MHSSLRDNSTPIKFILSKYQDSTKIRREVVTGELETTNQVEHWVEAMMSNPTLIEPPWLIFNSTGSMISIHMVIDFSIIDWRYRRCDVHRKLLCNVLNRALEDPDRGFKSVDIYMQISGKYITSMKISISNLSDNLDFPISEMHSSYSEICSTFLLDGGTIFEIASIQRAEIVPVVFMNSENHRVGWKLSSGSSLIELGSLYQPVSGAMRSCIPMNNPIGRSGLYQITSGHSTFKVASFTLTTMVSVYGIQYFLLKLILDVMRSRKHDVSMEMYEILN